jgi:hypothetical protein
MVLFGGELADFMRIDVGKVEMYGMLGGRKLILIYGIYNRDLILFCGKLLDL